MMRAKANALLALQQLEEFLAEPVANSRDRAGIIQAFEFTFEATWKLLQKVAVTEGLQVASPKRAIAAAFQLGLIEDEAGWLAMLDDRNLTTHVYNQVLAEQIYTRVRDSYGRLLRAAILLASAQTEPKAE